MTEHTAPKRRAYRLPPCPSYDVEGIESWLSDLAARQGLFLAKDSLLGIRAFERGTPRPARYRLEAAPKSTSLWAEDGGEPAPEAVALGAEYGWEYLTRCGEFYVYRTFEPGARELNTDPAVQAIALNAVRKRRRAALAGSLLYPALLLFALLRMDALLLTVIQARTWYALLLLVLVVWLFADAAAEFFHLRKLYQRLRRGEPLTHRADWQKRAVRHYAKDAVQLVLALVFLAVTLHTWSARTLGEDRIPLAEYPGDPPFVTMAGLAGPGAYGYQSTMTGQSFNTVRVWHDWLAPYNADWHEQASVCRADGSTLNGGLLIDCHEAASPWLARQLAREYTESDARAEDAAPLPLPALPVEYAAGSTDRFGFPTVTLQNGRQVLHVTFVFSDLSELDEWLPLFAARMQ